MPGGITLNELLQSRDERAALQESFLSRFPGQTLLCLTVQLPGPVKRSDESLVIARAGVEALREAFPQRCGDDLLRDLETGFEGYFVVPLNALDAKRACCEIEDSHPLGRLMDIDVIVADGPSGSAAPVSRQAVGLPERRCLLCDNPARYCMRARTHSVDELLAAISAMVISFVAR